MSPSFDYKALGLSQNNANEFLQSASVQLALVSHRHEKWVHEVSEASLTMLDFCGATKDVLLLMKRHLEVLQTKYRRHGLHEHGKQQKTAEHGLTNLKNQIRLYLKSLRGMNDKHVAADHIAPDCRDSIVSVVNMLRDVRLACIHVLEWALSIITDKRNSARWSLWSMVMCGQGQSKIMSEEVAMEAGGSRVVALENVSNELESTFRRLIQTRVSLLNILASN